MNIEKQIEFDKVKEIWMNLAVTEAAKEQIREKSYCLSERELRKQIKDTTDSRNMIEKLGTPPLQNVAEIKDILQAAEKGDCLTPYQLERVEKVLVAIRRLKDSGLPFISVLTDPTTGGVSASYAMLGDINITEPGALIGFAGRRVIENTIRQKLPDDFQTAEYLKAHGFIDKIVERKDLKAFIVKMLKYFGF